MDRKFDNALIFKDTNKAEIVESYKLIQVRKNMKETNAKPVLTLQNGSNPVPINLKIDVFCPECGKPNLTVTDSYIKTRNKQEHEDDCSYGFDTLNVTQMRHFLKSETGKLKIINKINKLYSILNSSDITNTNKKTVNKLIHSTNIVRKVNGSLLLKYKGIKKSLPQQKFMHGFKPRHDLCVYYGRVYITQSERQKNLENENYSIRILYKDKLEYLCNLNFKMKYKYFDEIKKIMQNNLTDIENNVCKPINLVIFGSFSEYNGFYTLHVTDSRFISISL